MSVIILTTGVPGCGKTYIRCARFLVDDFLVNSNGLHISNFPIKKDVISEFVSKKINKSRGFFGIFKKKVSPEDISNRLEIIPDEVLQSWRAGTSGPWEYFKGRDLKYAHLAIDEIHNFLNSRCSESVLKQWDDFLGEIRHRGCTFEGLTQDSSQVDQVLIGRASVRLELVPGEDLRDPFFKIKMSDWYELKASFLGSYHKTTFVYEKRKQDSRWKTNHVSRFLITPDYFKFYNSFNASLQEKKDGSSDDDRTPLLEYQKRGKISLLLWFLRRNFFTLFLRISIAIFLFWLCFLGGLNFIINGWLSASKSAYKSNSSSVVRSSTSSSFTPSSHSSKYTSNSVPKNLEEARYFDKKKSEFEMAFRPALFFDGKCWLHNGQKIYVGYKFNNKSADGDYYGKIVVYLSVPDRSYTLDNGITIFMY